LTAKLSTSRALDARAAADRPAGPASGGVVAIFRPRALERYARRAEEQVLPRLSKPRELVWLWALVVLLTAGCVAAALALRSSSPPGPPAAAAPAAVAGGAHGE
jgi:hypothetical protein